MPALQTTDSLQLDGRFLRRLEALRLQLLRSARHVSTQGTQGRHLSHQAGTSLEFSEYRAYSPGDDFRHVDWSIYGRLGRLYSKRFESEQDMHVHILLDVSRSMHWQPGAVVGSRSPSLEKFRLALHLAATVSCLVLHNSDRVHLCFFDDKITRQHHSRRNRLAVQEAFKFLNSANSYPSQARQNTKFKNTFREFIRQSPPPGPLIIISDFFDPDFSEKKNTLEIFRQLRAARLETTLLQTLHAEELNPTHTSLPTGEILLKDHETGQQRNTFSSHELIAAYRKKIRQFNENLAASARACGFGCSQINTGQHLDKNIFRLLRESRLF